MGQHSKHIDNLFKDELGAYAETPPPMAWDALEKRLDKLPPRGAAINPGKALYLVMVTSLLLLSVSVAKKLYVDHKAYLSSDVSAINVPVKGNNPAAGRPVSEAAGTQIADKSISGSLNNNPDKNQIKNNIADQTIPGNSNSGHKKALQVYKKMTGIKGLKKDTYTTATKSNTQASGSGNEKELADNQEIHEYNSSRSTGDADQSSADNKTKDNINDKQKPGPAPDKPKTDNATAKLTEKPKPSKPRFIRFEAGIKAGYETGFNTTTANKLVVSPYVQYNITPKFSIMIQPAIKKGTLQTSSIGKAQNYYKENNDSSISSPVKEPYIVHVPGVGDFNKWDFTYHQSYDSIVKSYSFGGGYTEYELPVLIKYNIAHGISVYGGVNLVYNNYLKVKENTYSSTQQKNDTSQYVLQAIEITTPPSPQLNVNQVLKYTGNEISNYKYPFPPVPASSFRAGYMVGFSYEYQKRWLFDGLMQQTQAPTNMQGGYNINSALSSTYFRFTLGYKLIK